MFSSKTCVTSTFPKPIKPHTVAFRTVIPLESIHLKSKEACKKSLLSNMAARKTLYVQYTSLHRSDKLCLLATLLFDSNAVFEIYLELFY